MVWHLYEIFSSVCSSLTLSPPLSFLLSLSLPLKQKKSKVRSWGCLINLKKKVKKIKWEFKGNSLRVLKTTTASKQEQNKINTQAIQRMETRRGKDPCHLSCHGCHTHDWQAAACQEGRLEKHWGTPGCCGHPSVKQVHLDKRGKEKGRSYMFLNSSGKKVHWQATQLWTVIYCTRVGGFWKENHSIRN